MNKPDNKEQRKKFEAWLKSKDLKPVAWIKDEYWKVWLAAVNAQEQKA